MIDQGFKLQPVAAFYRLFAKSFVYMAVLSLLLSVPLFYLFTTAFESVLGSDGLKQLQELMTVQPQNAEGIARQSKAMQAFLSGHPGAVPVFFGIIFMVTLAIAYLFKCTQYYLKGILFGTGVSIAETLKPGKEFIQIFLFIMLMGVFFVFTGGFVTLLFTTSPLTGVIGLILLGVILTRTVLFISGIVLGEMQFNESLKYTLQTISIGRGFKILIFGTLVFLVWSFILSALLYFPATWLKASSFSMFLNIFNSFLQLGFISTGMAALFMRYGYFEAEAEGG